MSEQLKIMSLFRLKRVLEEKWNDDLDQILYLSHTVGHSVAVIHANHAASEIGLKCLKNLIIALVLHDGEFREYLNSGCHFLVSTNSHMEAAFSVHKACDPLSLKS